MKNWTEPSIDCIEINQTANGWFKFWTEGDNHVILPGKYITGNNQASEIPTSPASDDGKDGTEGES